MNSSKNIAAIVTLAISAGLAGMGCMAGSPDDGTQGDDEVQAAPADQAAAVGQEKTGEASQKCFGGGFGGLGGFGCGGFGFPGFGCGGFGLGGLGCGGFGLGGFGCGGFGGVGLPFNGVGCLLPFNGLGCAGFGGGFGLGGFGGGCW